MSTQVRPGFTSRSAFLKQRFGSDPLRSLLPRIASIDPQPKDSAAKDSRLTSTRPKTQIANAQMGVHSAKMSTSHHSLVAVTYLPLPTYHLPKTVHVNAAQTPS